ncbi:MAG: TIGR03936 family radical SAM-associated protein [Elusimicrobiota bacterium]
MPSIERLGGHPGAVRYRVRFSRRGPAAGLTHLAQIERVRRAVVDSGLPAILNRQRKAAKPKLAFGPAISLGYESLAEYFDMELAQALPPSEVAAALGAAFKDGLELRAVRRIPLYFPSLDASINVARYEISGPFPEDAAQSLARFLDRSEIVIEKLKDAGARVERIEARRLIVAMHLTGPGRLELDLRFGPNRTLKPEALLREWLGLVDEGLAGFRILRKELLSETSRGEFLIP